MGLARKKPPCIGRFFVRRILLSLGKRCARAVLFIYTHPPRRRGLRLLAAISTGYAFSLAPSLLLSAKKRRLRFGFFAVYALRRRGVLSIAVYPSPFFAHFTEQGLPFPLATCVTVQAYTACQPIAYNKSRSKAAFNVMYYATSHLYFSTLYRGTQGISMGTVFTYC